MKRVVTVIHKGYGCETGCCGHSVVIEHEGKEDSYFEFEHPDTGESDMDFAKRLVREGFGEDHVADLDWENCEISSG